MLLEAMRIRVMLFLPLAETFHYNKYTSLKTKRNCKIRGGKLWWVFRYRVDGEAMLLGSRLLALKRADQNRLTWGIMENSAKQFDSPIHGVELSKQCEVCG